MQYKYGKIDFWDNVYDFDMTNIKKWVLREPVIGNVNENQINSDKNCIF